jgi:hypothetical protein
LTNLQPAHFGVYTVSIADALSDRILFKVEHHTGQAPPPPVLTGGTPDHPTTCIDPIDCNPPTEPAPSIWQRISTWFNTLFRKITK